MCKHVIKNIIGHDPSVKDRRRANKTPKDIIEDINKKFKLK